MDFAYVIARNLAVSLPQKEIVADHSPTQHFYRDCRSDSFENASRLPSVTTKTSILEKKYLKSWAVRRGLAVIREAYEQTGTISEQDYQRAEQAHEAALASAGDIGTNVHKAAEQYLNEWVENSVRPTERTVVDYLETHGDDVNPQEVAGARSAQAFLDAHDFTPIISEIKIVNPVEYYAGTCDALVVNWEVYKSREGDPQCSHTMVEDEKRPNHKWCFCGREMVGNIVLIDWKTSNSIDKPEYAHQITAYSKGLEREARIVPDELWIVQLSKDKADYKIKKVADKKQAWKEFKAISKAYDTMQARTNDLLVGSVETLKIEI